MALSFDANTDKVTTTHTADPTTRTWAMWVYFDGTGHGAGGGFSLFYKGNAAFSTVSYFLSGNDTKFFYGQTWSTAAAQWEWSARPANGAWHHVAFTYDGGATTNDPACYVNGSVQSVTETTTPTGTLTTTTELLTLANIIDFYVLNGDMADFGMWNRILSADDIAALAKGFSPLHFPVGLIVHTPLIRDGRDWCAAAATVSGTSIVAHPRIYHPEAGFQRHASIPQTVTLTGIATAEAFGTPTVFNLNQTVSLTGIATAEAFGTMVPTIPLTGIVSGEAFGTMVPTIPLTGIATAEAFGTPTVTNASDPVVTLTETIRLRRRRWGGWFAER